MSNVRDANSRRGCNAAASPDELHTVMALWHTGSVSKAEIARQTGFSYAAVGDIVRRFTVGGRKLPPASNKAPQRAAPSCEPLRDITTRYSVFETEYDRVVASLRAAAPGVTGMVNITVTVPF